MGRRRRREEHHISIFLPSSLDTRKVGRMPCRTCRDRHLGCDEAKPVCGPCKKSSRECKWPTDEYGRVFRSENDNARRRAVRGWRSRAKTDKDRERASEEGGRTRSRSNSVASSIEPSASPQRRRSELSRRPSLMPQEMNSEKELAVYRFFHDHVATPSGTATDRVHGYLYFLPEMYSNAEQDSHLYYSVLALALATHLNREPTHPNFAAVSYEASECYGKALELVKGAVGNPYEGLQDETLVSSFLLSLYELMCSNDSTSWHPHCNGMFILIQHRGAEQFRRPLGVELFRIVLLHTITTCLTWRQKPPQPFDAWASLFGFMPTSTYEVVRQMFSTVELCAEAVGFMQSRPSSSSAVCSSNMIKDLQTQERQLWYLERRLNQDNPFEEYEWPPTYLGPELDFFKYWTEGCPSRYHVYKDARRAGWINILRATRLIINEVILDMCTGGSPSTILPSFQLPINTQLDLSHTPEHIAQEIEAIVNIHKTAANICASLPNQIMLTSSLYASESIESSTIATIQDAFGNSAACPRGFFIVWPLHTVEQTLTRITARHGIDVSNAPLEEGRSSAPPNLPLSSADLYTMSLSPPQYAAPLPSARMPSTSTTAGPSSGRRRQRAQASEPPGFPDVTGGSDNALLELSRMLRWVRYVSINLGTEGHIVG